MNLLLNERPIFIIGAQRSGTTLLRYILSSHPRIYIPPESNFIPRYFGSSPNGTISRKRAIEIVEGILTYRMFFKDWKQGYPNPEHLVDSLPHRTPEYLLDALYSQYAALFDAPRWGDKTPIYSDYIDLLTEIFPKAQFIHIIRDGRDVALSMLNAYKGIRFFYVDIYYAAYVWNYRVNNARRSGGRIGQGKYYELHYEDLTADPVNEIKMICDFLDEDYDESMTAPHSTAAEFHHSEGIHAGTRKHLNTDSVGKWKTRMSMEDLQLFQNVAGQLLADLGYNLRDVGGNSITETVRFAGLKSKYNFIQYMKRLLKSLGVFHPTDILSRYFEPYPKRTSQ